MQLLKLIAALYLASHMANICAMHDADQLAIANKQLELIQQLKNVPHPSVQVARITQELDTSKYSALCQYLQP